MFQFYCFIGPSSGNSINNGMKEIFFGKKLFYLLAIQVAALFLFPPLAGAAGQVLYFDASARSVGVGEELAIGIFIDTDQPVNAYAVNFVFSSAALEVVGLDNSRSIIDVWPGEPLVHESGTVSFKGGSLHPFSGERGELLTIRFRALKAGPADFQFGDSALYLANGKGTKIIPQIKNLSFTVVAPREVSGEARPQSAELASASLDANSPEILFIGLIQDPINSEQKFLSFQASDRDSGIKDVFYQSRSWIFWSDAQNAQNPVALPAGVWSARITVHDNAGNAADKTVYDWYAFLWGPLAWLVLAIVAGAFLFRKTWYSKRTILKI